VYHHFPDPAAMNRSLLASLKPGGRLAIIDFVPRKGSELPNGAPANRGGHGITAGMLRDEVIAAGFTAGDTIERWDGSNGVYLVVFRKP
jgi:predicted methyltransferase